MQGNSSFQLGAPSTEVINFLNLVETADPNSPDISEDDKNDSWGHHSLSGSTSLLASWNNIGNTAIACRLIAAAVKTCKVARHICFIKQINPSGYLADIYLSNIVESLWKSWSTAVGIKVSKIPQDHWLILIIYSHQTKILLDHQTLHSAPPHCRRHRQLQRTLIWISTCQQSDLCKMICRRHRRRRDLAHPRPSISLRNQSI